MLKSYKYRLMPTKDQSILIDKHIGACRFIYNLALETKAMAYSGTKKNVTSYELISQLPDLKKDFPWLNEVDSQALQQSIVDLEKAYLNFFKLDYSFPKFKNKNSKMSFRNPHGRKISIKSNKLFQSNFRDGIKIIIDRPFIGEIKNTTISKTVTNKYFVSILVEDELPTPIKSEISEETCIGIDLGIKSFIVTSDGLKVDNPNYFKNESPKLKYLHRQSSKKKKGSNNQKKAQLKSALCYEKAINKKHDFLHKLSNEIIKCYDTICFETLDIECMLKNPILSKYIHPASWATFVQMCKYKSAWNGKNILQIPTFQPSTKVCSNCEFINNDLKLSDREWICPNCGKSHDRDLNAAINIKNFCLKFEMDIEKTI